MSVPAVEQESPRAFLDRLQESVAIEGQQLWPPRHFSRHHLVPVD